MSQLQLMYRCSHHKVNRWLPLSQSVLPCVLVRSPSTTTPSRSLSQQTKYNDYLRAVKSSVANFKAIRNSPSPALALGIAGLIPFVTVPAHMLTSGVFIPELAYASLAYGATILSFLGGCRWGLTVQHPQVNRNSEPSWCNLSWSVTPSLIAWTSLLLPHGSGTLTVVAGLSAALLKDLADDVYPPWFKSLRILLTTVAVLALSVSLVCSLALPRETRVRNE